MKRMKHGLYPTHWLLIAALIWHGALPGVVMCFGRGGHVAVEIFKDQSHYRYIQPASSLTLSLIAITMESTSKKSCGPCEDTPILPIAISTKKPAPDGKRSVGMVQSATLTFYPTAIRTHMLSASPSVAADAALIPIRTTTLLI